MVDLALDVLQHLLHLSGLLGLLLGRLLLFLLEQLPVLDVLLVLPVDQALEVLFLIKRVHVIASDIDSPPSYPYKP